MKLVRQEDIDKGFSYLIFRKQVKEWLDKGRTSGNNHSPSMLEYTYLNSKRMDRLDKTVKLSDTLITRLKEIKSKQHWVVIVEAWCGDVAQNVPVLVKMAAQNENIKLTLIYRDENPGFMDMHLTDGARSIPKLIIFDEQFNELESWGPRPKPVQEMLVQYKNDPGESYQHYAKRAHTWYAKDRNKTIQEEFEGLIDNITLDHQKVA